MTISNEIVLLIISGVGVILWWFVVNLIKELKDQNTINMKMLINMEKEVVLIRERMNNYDERIKRLEDTRRENLYSHSI